jgi:histidinol-phosphate aminotransferase
LSPRLRSDLRALAGYHSPQVDVPVRLNTNESPYPPPAPFVDEVSRVVARIPFNRYPDRHNRALRTALAELRGVDPGRIFPANGSNEVLQTLLLAFGGAGRTALAFTPTYSLHGQIARATGTEFVEVPRDEDLRIGPAAVAAAIGHHAPEIVFFCNPNNPTGLGEEATAMQIAAEDPNRLVIVDEAYEEFASRSALDWAGATPNVVVVRTLSKAWAIPSCRVGYMVAPSELVASLDAVELPYHMSALTQEVGRLALTFVREMQERVKMICSERDRVVARVSDIPGVRVWTSEANFFLIRPVADAKAVWQGLLDRGVLVRDFSSRADLPGCLRVTVGTPDENEAFLTALAAVATENEE